MTSLEEIKEKYGLAKVEKVIKTGGNSYGVYSLPLMLERMLGEADIVRFAEARGIKVEGLTAEEMVIETAVVDFRSMEDYNSTHDFWNPADAEGVKKLELKLK